MNNAHDFQWFVTFITCWLTYFLPSLVGLYRMHKDFPAILVMNVLIILPTAFGIMLLETSGLILFFFYIPLFFVLTGLAWCVAVIWSFKH